MTGAALCIVAGALVASVPAERFTLAWRHTVEKVEWEEDYRIAGGWLHATGARIRGSGAGMEPPDGAFLEDGVWHYRPAQRWHRELVLAASEFGNDYALCVDGRCRPLADRVPHGSGPVALKACGSVPGGGAAR